MAFPPSALRLGYLTAAQYTALPSSENLIHVEIVSALEVVVALMIYFFQDPLCVNSAKLVVEKQQIFSNNIF